MSLSLLSYGAFASADAIMEIHTIELPQNGFDQGGAENGADKQILPLGKDQIVPKPGSSGDIGGSGSGGIIPPLGGGDGGGGGGIFIPPPVPGPIGGIGGIIGGGGFGGGPLDQVGQVISMAQNVVALGEQVYTLVQKGKPSITTEYAPISIVPMDPMTKEVVNPFDMDDCAVPQQKKYRTVMKSGSSVVVNFEYAVIYSANCSYNGVGKYIQTLNIIPTKIKVGYGWDVTAQMKLTGLMNHGKRDNPNVGALLTIKYTMKSWRTALEKNDTIHVTGAGVLKSYSVK